MDKLRKRIRPIQLKCCHCGTNCLGRPWFNRDKCHGVCPDCVKSIRKDDRTSAEEQHDMWGIEGVHYNVPDDTVPPWLKDLIPGEQHAQERFIAVS